MDSRAAAVLGRHSTNKGRPRHAVTVSMNVWDVSAKTPSTQLCFLHHGYCQPGQSQSQPAKLLRRGAPLAIAVAQWPHGGPPLTGENHTYTSGSQSSGQGPEEGGWQGLHSEGSGLYHNS